MATQPIYQFYSELKDYVPAIWRRFQVAGNINLARLGYIVMTMYEMQANHVFSIEFSLNENMEEQYRSEPDKLLRYMVPTGESFPDVMDENAYDATTMTLRRFFRDEGTVLHFFYDFGDGWEVTLRLEEVFEDRELPGNELPRVIAGEGFGIVENCGGSDGLSQAGIDLSAFDIDDINFRLKKLPRIYRDLYELDYAPTQQSIDLIDRKYKNKG